MRDGRLPEIVVQTQVLLLQVSATVCVGPTLCRGRRPACGEGYSLRGVVFGGAEEEGDEVAEDDDCLAVGELGLSYKVRSRPAAFVEALDELVFGGGDGCEGDGEARGL